MEKPIIKYLPVNHNGRDFVVGDLHGELGKLLDLLNVVGFTANDRLFSVGDLVDRGQDSVGCLQLLDRPWFFAVRGNHEDMLLDYVGSRFFGEQPRYSGHRHPFTANGGDWFTSNSSGEMSRLAGQIMGGKLSSLPHIIIVGADSGEKRFHVVHAELDGGEKVDRAYQDRFIATDAILDNGSQFPDVEFIDGFGGYGDYVYRLMWGREIVRNRQFIDIGYREGLSATFCGHTIFPDKYPVILDSHVHLDIGAFMSGTLTMVEVGRDNARDFSVISV